MTVHNKEIADAFNELGDLLEIEGANEFRVRAYRNAAQVIRGLSKSLADMREDGEDFSDLHGIGDDLAGKIEEMLDSGELADLEAARQRTGPELAQLMRVEGLGPKRVRQLYEELGIRGLGDLKDALEQEKLRELEGLGRKTEEKIARAVQRLDRQQRTQVADVEEIADALLDYIRSVDGVKEAIIAGSYRRRKATVGDLDILVIATKQSPVMDRFVNYEEVDEVVSKGETRSTVRLRSGISVDLRDVRQASYGAALMYFTGSKEHNIAVRRMGVEQGLKFNEYGVYKNDRKVAGKTEKEVYGQVGMAWVPPELRENRGEIDAALKDKLPELVEPGDIRGDLHAHTSSTDGRDSIETMAKAARELDYDYLAITDHSKRMSITGGLDADGLRKQCEKIDAANERLDGITLLKSIELDILEDGSLDLPDDVLDELDLVVVAVHTQFGLSRKKQTNRIIKALDNPRVNILAHPSGRLINEREAYDVDMERVMEAALERGCFLEIDAQPDRLDLADVHCKAAKEMGLKLALSSDAHSADGLRNLRFGLDQARRGWLEKADIINTRSLTGLRDALRR